MQDGLWTSLAAGCALGFSAGIAPGPLLTLTISETLQHGLGAGAKVALAPLITDPPIILATALLLAQVAHAEPILGTVSLAGGVVLLWIAWGTWRARPPRVNGDAPKAKSLRKGVAANFLNPHVYLFWGTVGAPFLIAPHAAPLAPACFLAGFYLCLVSAKLTVAGLTEKSRSFLNSTAYRATLKLLALVLAALALFFFRDAARLFAG